MSKPIKDFGSDYVYRCRSSSSKMLHTPHSIDIQDIVILNLPKYSGVIVSTLPATPCSVLSPDLPTPRGSATARISTSRRLKIRMSSSSRVDWQQLQWFQTHLTLGECDNLETRWCATSQLSPACNLVASAGSRFDELAAGEKAFGRSG